LFTDVSAIFVYLLRFVGILLKNYDDDDNASPSWVNMQNWTSDQLIKNI